MVALAITIVSTFVVIYACVFVFALIVRIFTL